MYRIEISPKAKKELKKIKKLYKRAIAQAIDELKEDPFVGKPLTRELTGKFSLKVGVSRIIYKVNNQDKTVQVIAAGHRGAVYK